MGDALGDRMKAYEVRETGRAFLPMLPVYARIDGRCFSRFTASLERPSDIRMTRVMLDTTKWLVAKTHARIGYTQSDEINLVWLQDRLDSDILFAGKVQKMTSVLAGMASARFNHACEADDGLRELAQWHVPHFDCRVFQLPTPAEAANVFLWRELDATKNAVSMAARAYYSHNSLHGKNAGEMQEMLFAKGINFNDYPAYFKRGTFVRRESVERHLTAEELLRIPEQHRPSGPVLRSSIEEMEMPQFSKVTNREAVIFDGAAPLTDTADRSPQDAAPPRPSSETSPRESGR